MKKFLTFFLTLLLIILPITSNAGFFKKGVKGYVASRVISKSIKKVAAKRIAAKSVKGFSTKNLNKLSKLEKQELKKAKKIEISKSPLEKDELTVGKYKQLIKKTSDDNQLTNNSRSLEVHHMPSTEVLKRNGIDKGDGIAVKLLKERHQATRTYGGRNTEDIKSETMRDALARDVKDFRNLYKHDTSLNQKTRDIAKDVIKKNKEAFPDKFKKD